MRLPRPRIENCCGNPGTGFLSRVPLDNLPVARGGDRELARVQGNAAGGTELGGRKPQGNAAGGTELGGRKPGTGFLARAIPLNAADLALS